MTRTAGPALAALVCLAALYGVVGSFMWQVVVASALLVTALASMAWLGGSPRWRPAHRLWWSPTVLMAALYVAAAALVFVDLGLGRHVPSRAILVTFLLAPLPWVLLGCVASVEVVRQGRARRS